MKTLNFSIQIKVTIPSDLSSDEQEELEEALQAVLDDHEEAILAEVRTWPEVKAGTMKTLKAADLKKADRIIDTSKDKRHPKNNTRYKTLDYICDDHRVVKIWDEEEDGIWIQLAEGYNINGCSFVLEWSIRDLLHSFENNVEKGPTY